MPKKLILASSSPGRKQVMENAGFQFEVIPSNYEEDMTLKLPSHDLAILLSQGKARDVAGKLKEGIVIGADTFGVYGNQFLGKPHTEENAIRMLTTLSNNVHSMVTGITIIDVVNNREISKSAETKIWFREIPQDEIVEYIKTGESLKKAGGYMYQGTGHKFVQKTEGSETNIMGLPIEVVREVLNELGS